MLVLGLLDSDSSCFLSVVFEPEVQGYLMGPARTWRSSVDVHMGMRGFRFSLGLDWGL